LYTGKVKSIAEELVRELIQAEVIAVEPEELSEVQLDVESVLKEYINMDRRITEEAREVMEKRGLDFGAFGRIKREVAKKYNFGIGENAPGWIIDQLIEVLLHTSHVEEVWVEDHDLRRLMRPVLQRQMELEGELDADVRNQIKNLQEGSMAWDLKYEQVMQEMKKRKGLV
jgi:hypothetical protein